MKNCIFRLVILFCLQPLQAQFRVDTTQTTKELVDAFMGDGVNVFNLRFKGSKSSIGYFEQDSTNFPIASGLVLSTGRVQAICGPANTRGNLSTSQPDLSTGDNDLYNMVRKNVYNVTVIEFDFIPQFDSIYFDYVFASEEYKEFVGSKFNDVFCFLVDGPLFSRPENIARVGSPPVSVSVNNINHLYNKQLFIDNTGFKPTEEIPYTVEFDGFTTVLTARCRVARGKKYHIKIAIGNVNDFAYDSGVLLRARSFSSKGDVSGRSKIIFPFDFNSAGLQEQFFRTIDSLGKLLKENPPMKLSVLGHTDSLGSKEYNDSLSYRRAREVADLLLKAGANPRQLVVRGYGFSKPVNRNDSEEGRAANRRVELILQRKP